MIVRTASPSFPTGLLEPARSDYRQLRNRKRFYVQRLTAYKKSLFQELNGFQGNDTIASGDDVIAKAIAPVPDRVHYVKSKGAL
jgi:hypothetical protein